MNKLFNAVNNLFESENPVVLTERGHKYIKDLPSDEIEDKGYRWAKTKVDDNGKRMDADEARQATRTRMVYDVIKHLAPEGYHFDIQKSHSYRDMDVILVNNETKDSIRLCEIEFNIDEDDNVVAKVKKHYSVNDNQISSIFNKNITIKDVATELAKEKGEDLTDEFMIDNGAEIKARFNELKSKNTGTLEELISKLEKQINKIPTGSLLKTLRSVNKESEALVKENNTLNEDYDPSMPNWLKTAAIKGRSNWRAPRLDSNTQFRTLSKDELQNITKMAKQAQADGQLMFIRLGNSAFWYEDRRWRQVLDYNNQRSEADMMAAINNEHNKASGCVTINWDRSLKINNTKADERKDARKGSVNRYPDRAGEKDWDGNVKFDKSGYAINPNKYKDMLRKIKQDNLASSDTLAQLENGNYVKRFNELGKKAAEFISQNLNIEYKDSQSHYGDNYIMDTSIIDKVKSAARVASASIKQLMRKIDYVKTGDSNKLAYGEDPETTDMESWIKDQVNKVEEALNNFDSVITKAEDTTKE